MKNMNLLLGVSIVTLASQSAVIATQQSFDDELVAAIELSKKTAQEDRDRDMARQLQAQYDSYQQPRQQVQPYQAIEQKVIQSSIGQAKLQEFEKKKQREILESRGLGRQQDNYEAIRDANKHVVPGIFHPHTSREENSDFAAALGKSRGEALDLQKEAEKKAEKEAAKKQQQASPENKSVADKKKFFEKKKN